MPYVPHQGSLAQRICEYLKQIPTEELTATELASKFDASVAQVHSALNMPVKKNVLIAGNTESGQKYWRAGPNIAQLPTTGHSAKPESPFHVWLNRKGQESAEGIPKRAPLPDPSTIQIEAGVPIPEKPMPKPKPPKFETVFERMQPGDSFSVEQIMARRIILAAQRYAKKSGGTMKFVMRSFDDGTGRIWRVE